MRLAFAVVAIITMQAINLVAADSGLKNGALALTDGGDAVTAWRMTPKLPLATTTGDLPEGLASALAITVKGVSRNDGQLTQFVYLKEGQPARFRLSAWLKSEQPRCGYIQVKLYAGKKESSRETIAYSTKAWQQITAQIDATGASKVEIVCRWRHYDKYEGSKVWFGSLDLKPIDKVIALAGDSTVQDYEAGNPTRGWGQLLPEFVQPSVGVANHAAGGRSTKTFREEKRWEKLLATKPDVVLIQFGHNDSHQTGRPEATDAATDFPANLRLYVTEARAAGIVPILVTPPHRRVFRADGSLATSLDPYAAATRSVAAELKVPCIDLYELTGKELLARGEDGSLELYASVKDRSHFSEKGARWLAGLVAATLAREAPELAPLLKPPVN